VVVIVPYPTLSYSLSLAEDRINILAQHFSAVQPLEPQSVLGFTMPRSKSVGHVNEPHVAVAAR
jgi:hypothetical protein